MPHNPMSSTVLPTECQAAQCLTSSAVHTDQRAASEQEWWIQLWWRWIQLLLLLAVPQTALTASVLQWPME
jgi:hypothetical protein